MPLIPKKILVATDFSAHAVAAVDAAAVMARAFGGELTVLHAVPLSLYADAAVHLESSSFSATDLKATVMAKVQSSAAAEVARLAKEGIDAKFLYVDGPAPAEIARVAAEGKFDLVVVGAHGHTGRRHLALGTVAENIVRLCSTPILVVPSDVPAPPVT